MRAFALITTRTAFDVADHPGASFLARANFRVRLLVNHTSIFDAYESGLRTLEREAAPQDLIVFLHDDVAFDGISGDALMRTLRRHATLPGAGFVGAAGCRTLHRELAWWRNASTATALAGMVHHGRLAGEAAPLERAFFGPPGRVVVLDGLILAATARTLRSLRLTPPAAHKAPWHFYDVSFTLQAHAAGLRNVALPLGVVHASKGQTDETWQAARAALAARLRPLLPTSVSGTPVSRPHRRVALLLRPSAENADALLPGSNRAIRDALAGAGYEVLDVYEGGLEVGATTADSDDGGTSGGAMRPSGQPPDSDTLFRWLDLAARDSSAAASAPFEEEDEEEEAASAAAAAVASIGEDGGALVAVLRRLAADDTLAIVGGDSLLITPSADIDWLVEAALMEPRMLVSSLGCTRACTSDVDGSSTMPDVGVYMAVGALKGETTAARGSGELNTFAPPTRVEAFARGGMLFGKWGTYRLLHSALEPGIRAELSRSWAAVPLASSHDDGVGDSRRMPSFEALYSQLARVARLEMRSRSVQREVVPIVPILMGPPPMGRCECVATTTRLSQQSGRDHEHDQAMGRTHGRTATEL
jgi:hypothetical protein